MISKYYTIRDLKVGFQSLQNFPNDDAAIRAFKILAADSSTVLHSNPSDFELWFVGDFDLENGAFISNPQFLCNVGVSNG